jgi:hypothetical protein
MEPDMRNYMRDDPVMAALRDARPVTGPPPSASEPKATALLSRIVAVDPAAVPARERRRGRRVSPGRLRVLSAGAALVAVCAGVLAVTGAFNTGGTGGLHRGTATLDARMVALRANAATGTAAETNIEHTAVTRRNRAGNVTTRLETWIYPGGAGPAARLYRIEAFTRSGALAFDESRVTSGGVSSGRVVNYARRGWFTTRQGAAPAPRLGFAYQIRLNLKYGWYRVAGTAIVDGQRTIKLTATFGGRAPAGRDTVWVNATSYLLVQAESVSRNGTVSRVTTSWLVPTKANLALLQAPVPHGFKRLTGPAS